MSDTKKPHPSRAAYLARFGTETAAARFEERMLALAPELLPACALAARDGAEPTPEYFGWLIAQHEAVTSEGDS